MALPLADLGDSGWRYVYLVTLIWLVVAVDITRRLPETVRFVREHVVAPRLNRRRFAILATVAICANFFVAPASFFQNRYLREVRGFDASTIALFTLTTATPAGIGLVIGGRLADMRGRRRVIAITVPVATGARPDVVHRRRSRSCGSAAFGGGFIGGIALPALAVYRAELFPTGNRGRAAGLLTAAALLGGIGGLLLVGQLIDAGWSYGQAIGLVALAQLIVVVVGADACSPRRPTGSWRTSTRSTGRSANPTVQEVPDRPGDRVVGALQVVALALDPEVGDLRPLRTSSPSMRRTRRACRTRRSCRR